MFPQIPSAAKYALIAAISAAGMYWFDPQQGRRRRALARDKIVSGFNEARRATGVVGRDTRHRLQGTPARTRSLIRSSDVSDEVLVERVRAALGRATSHSGAIEVSCSQGVVTLRGAVLKHEHPRVVRAARSAGGGEVHDELAAYKRADGVSALQGEHSVPKQGLPHIRENWSPTARLVACASGALLTLWSLRQRSPLALLASAAGSVLMIRGASNRTLKRYTFIETGTPARDAGASGGQFVQEPWQSRSRRAETQSQEPGAIASP